MAALSHHPTLAWIVLCLLSILRSVGAACSSDTASTVTKNYTIKWRTAAPDGGTPREVIGIVDGNSSEISWPPPTLYATKGDRIVINVLNKLNVSTSLHFHGIFQHRTPHNDGAVGVTQCPIPPNESFVYNFTATQSGTYWYHSHVRGQYPDGLRAPLIICDPKDPYTKEYDEEIILTFSDWYRKGMAELMEGFMDLSNPGGREPLPDALLINDKTGLEVAMLPKRRYLVRMVNMAAFASFRVWFQDHPMTVVEADGVYTKPTPLQKSVLYITAGQRYSVLITGKENNESNYPIIASMDTANLESDTSKLYPTVTGQLIYNSAKLLPTAKPLGPEVEDFDDVELKPHDDKEIKLANQLGDPDQVIWLTASFKTMKDGRNYGMFNDTTYMSPKVPTLYSALSLGNFSNNKAIYGTHVNPFIINKNETIEVIVYNDDRGNHPFHLHGHNFQILHRSEAGSGAPWTDPDVAKGIKTRNIPIRRDVVLVKPGGSLAIRFRADNPGVWLFHCHMEWHIRSGLMLTFIELPLEENITIEPVPSGHYAACAAATPATSTRGNAAGNTQNPLDLGVDPAPLPLPDGFTVEGGVLMFISILSGLTGCVVLWSFSYELLKLREP